ncbi:MAG: hypothetical protein JXR68_03040 [Bacteroidales bacterium]|nr:hypothetical protein [Bacteroidales bacterium]
MKNFIIIIFVVLLFVSCDKKTPPVHEILDKISYQNFDPNIEINTVKSFSPSPVPLNCNDIPAPSDSAVLFYFDFNSDSINDFVLNVSHSLYDYNYCGHCAVFTYSITIMGLSPGDSIALTDYQFPVVKFYNSSDTILFDNYWGDYAQIQLLEGCALPYHTDFSEGYIALKTDSNLVYLNVNKMPFNGISINSFGINNTKGRSIVCGQSE